ncbi:hypothetical protein ACAX46_004578 [Providencia rettgeri]
MTYKKSFSPSLLLTVCVLGLTFISPKVFAARYCHTTDGQDSYNVELKMININPAAQIGDIIAQSDEFQRTIECSSGSSMAQLKAQNNPLTDISITIPDKPIIPEQGSKCKAIDSGYPGIGVAWYNYNSRTNRWHCFSNNEAQIRMIGDSATLVDIIYLVKTGDISTGNFNFNRVFNIYEIGNGEDYGELYKITLSGNSEINAPVCKAFAKQGSGAYRFSTSDALNQFYSSEDRIVDILCTGYIPDQTIVPFQIVSENGTFPQSYDYYATSSDALGVSIKYKTNNDATEKVIIPGDRMMIPIMSNKAEVGLKFTPYIKDDSGVYPLLDEYTFNLSITASSGP